MGVFQHSYLAQVNIIYVNKDYSDIILLRTIYVLVKFVAFA